MYFLLKEEVWVPLVYFSALKNVIVCYAIFGDFIHWKLIRLRKLSCKEGVKKPYKNKIKKISSESF